MLKTEEGGRSWILIESKRVDERVDDSEEEEEKGKEEKEEKEIYVNCKGIKPKKSNEKWKKYLCL